MTKLLIDEQVWEIFVSPPAVRDTTLAQSMGVNQNTIHALRWKLRKHGWSCPVFYGTCERCGELFTAEATRGHGRRFHSTCYLEHKREQLVHLEKQRWIRHSEEKRRAILDKAHLHTRNGQEQTKARAISRGRRWQEWEDDLIQNSRDLTDLQLGLELGRTLIAVRTRRKVLRDRQKQLGVESTVGHNGGQPADTMKVSNS